MKKPKFITSLLISIIIVLSLVQIVVSNSLSTSGIQLVRLQNQIRSFERQNYTLKEQLLTDLSLKHIASSAAELGLGTQKSVITLSNSIPIAVKQ